MSARYSDSNLTRNLLVWPLITCRVAGTRAAGFVKRPEVESPPVGHYQILYSDGAADAPSGGADGYSKLRANLGRTDSCNCDPVLLNLILLS